MFKFLTLIAILSLGAGALAHEGHHGPTDVPPQNGGVMRALETVNLELTYAAKKVRIYAYDTAVDPKSPGKLHPVDVSKFPATATVELPKAKPTKLSLVNEGKHWSADLDPKGAHRFTILLEIRQGGHHDKIKWTVEPKE